MAQLAGFIFDQSGVEANGRPATRRPWSALTGVEIHAPIRPAKLGWEITFLFSNGEPLWLNTARERVEVVREALAAARRAAPPWAIFSERARLMLDHDPAPRDESLASLEALNARRARRQIARAWSMWGRLAEAGAADEQLWCSAVAMAEESGRCPGAVLERFENTLRRASRDPKTLELATRLYLAIDHEFAEAYARQILQRSPRHSATSVAMARWLGRQRRGTEAAALLRAAQERAPNSAEAQHLAATELAIERLIKTPDRRRLLARGAWIAAAAVAVLLLVFLGNEVAQRTEEMFRRRNEALQAAVARQASPADVSGTSYSAGPQFVQNFPTPPPHPDALKDLPENGPPACLSQARPQYPFLLRAKNIEGSVVVDFTVDPQGLVRNAYVITSTNEGFDSAALQAVTQWQFRPGTKNGQPVHTHMQVPVIFSLRDQPAKVDASR